MTQQKHLHVSTDLAPEENWTKSSYSSQDNQNCVETAKLVDVIGVRDSKAKQGPALAFTSGAWTSFIGLVNSGEADFGIAEH
ncbi:DUF397 domain-containing protein [Streptomyces sp. NPDC088554]|uniref:DUF397 domain-containing protein n=1 Tax=Streptomyces sp. NPDC088554 TaxID=3365865 RepID=UPI003802AC6C